MHDDRRAGIQELKDDMIPNINRKFGLSDGGVRTAHILRRPFGQYFFVAYIIQTNQFYYKERKSQ